MFDLPVSAHGRIIILNGTPRSGKSSIVSAIQNNFTGIWINLGVDCYMKMIPERYQPGIGLRPGGERPDLEPCIIKLYQAMYASIAAHSRMGINIVADVGHHDSYSSPLGILPYCAQLLNDFTVFFVGVHCPVDVIMERRINTWKSAYEKDGSIPKPVLAWQKAVHSPGIYDMEVDTSVHSPDRIAELIYDRLNGAPPKAFKRLAAMIHA